MEGYKYCVSFIDHYSRFTWLFPIRHKSDVGHLFPAFKTKVEKQFGISILVIYCYIFEQFGRLGEYQSLTKLLAIYGIKHLLTASHTLEHNELTERKHRHLVETKFILLHQT